MSSIAKVSGTSQSFKRSNYNTSQRPQQSSYPNRYHHNNQNQRPLESKNQEFRNPPPNNYQGLFSDGKDVNFSQQSSNEHADIDYNVNLAQNINCSESCQPDVKRVRYAIL